MMMSEALIRFGIFSTLLVVLILAEAGFERKARVRPRKPRWFTNISLTISNMIALFFLGLAIPMLAIGAAFDAANQGWGLFNILDFGGGWLGVAEFILAILILDFIIWGQHVITHKIPFLWRLHRVHHADRDIDATSGLRFHPIEIALSMLLKIGAVYLLGVSVLAVLVFEITLNAMAMFNHANLRLPLWLDAILRQFIVTPDMHRVHHSTHRREHDSNYGFFLSIWDRLGGTYIPQPEDGHDAMKLGLVWQDDKPEKLGWSLWLPFASANASVNPSVKKKK